MENHAIFSLKMIITLKKVALVQCPQQNRFKTRYKYVQMIREDIPSHNAKKKIMTKNSISLFLINNLWKFSEKNRRYNMITLQFQIIHKISIHWHALLVFIKQITLNEYFSIMIYASFILYSIVNWILHSRDIVKYRKSYQDEKYYIYNLLVWNWAGTDWKIRPITTDRIDMSARAPVDPNRTWSINKISVKIYRIMGLSHSDSWDTGRRETIIEKRSQKTYQSLLILHCQECSNKECLVKKIKGQL